MESSRSRTARLIRLGRIPYRQARRAQEAIYRSLRAGGADAHSFGRVGNRCGMFHDVVQILHGSFPAAERKTGRFPIGGKNLLGV